MNERLLRTARNVARLLVYLAIFSTTSATLSSLAVSADTPRGRVACGSASLWESKSTRVGGVDVVCSPDWTPLVARLGLFLLPLGALAWALRTKSRPPPAEA